MAMCYAACVSFRRRLVVVVYTVKRFEGVLLAFNLSPVAELALALSNAKCCHSKCQSYISLDLVWPTIWARQGPFKAMASIFVDGWRWVGAMTFGILFKPGL